ncbi:MAG: phospholipid carrier-dependent glycosyltransferase [Candidatus Poribacteria bacterium]|nr:phospholipid carrier-dependent glycosyltransferase [Candidatus Poribacteria bacterium]
MSRSRDFFFAMQTGKFADTYVSYHPGVTTCWLGSIAISEKYHPDAFSESWFDSDAFLSPEMLARVRLPIAVMTGILVLLAGFLLYWLFRDWMIAGLGILFLAVEPFLLAESRRARTDALTALFLFLSLLLWLYYLESETSRCRHIILSGICFALACLTKSLAVGFLFFLPLLLSWYFKQRGISWEKLILSVVLWLMSTLLIVLVTWPYMWIILLNPWNLPMFPLLFIGAGALFIWSCRRLSTDMPATFTQTELIFLGCGLLIIVASTFSALEPVIRELFAAARNANEIPTLFLGKIRSNPGVLYFPVMWFVWSTPLALPLIGTAIYRAWQQRDHGKKTFRVVVVLGFFALFYLIGLSLAAKKISRYIVIFLPVVSLLTTLGTVEMARLFKKKQARFIFIIAVVLLQIIPILRLHPYYRTYYYPLLSGKWVAANTSSITGAGLDLAADYLNALPNAQDLHIQLKSLFTHELAYYFVGHVTRTTETSDKFDYVVEHLCGKQIQRTPPKTSTQPSKQQSTQQLSRELEHVVRLNGIDYVWIYRMKSY